MRPSIPPWLGTVAVLAALTMATGSLFAVASPVPAGEPAVAWWAARATGLLAHFALLGTMSSGLLVSWRGLSGPLSQRRIFHVHDRLSLALVMLVALHIGSVLVVVIAPHGDVPIVLPLPATLAVLATFALAVIYAMRWLTSRMSTRRWRLVHRAAYVVLLLALGHAAMAGGELVESPLRWLYLTSGGTLLGALLFRIVFAYMGGVAVPLREAHTLGPEALDAESGLLKREGFVSALDAVVLQARSSGEQLTVVLIDVWLQSTPEFDRGAELSDGTPAWIGAQLRKAVRSSDLLGRTGPSEFAIAQRSRHPQQAAARILAAVAKSIESSAECSIEIGTGVAYYPAEAWQADGLLRRAAMAKMEGQIGQHRLILDSKDVA